MLTLALGVVLVTGCQTPASGAASTFNTVAPTPAATRAVAAATLTRPIAVATRSVAVAAATPTRPIAVAVAALSPTPTAVLVGDYASLVLPRLEVLQRTLRRLEQQLAVLQTAPLRMAEDDWRNQMQSILDDLLAASADVRSLGARVGARADLNPEVLKLADDLDFVANEYRLALDFDPDSSHFSRAGRARKSAADELDSVVGDVRRAPRAVAATATPTG